MEKVKDCVEIHDLNPMYELIFHDKKLKMTRNTSEMIRQIQETFPGNEGGYESILSKRKES